MLTLQSEPWLYKKIQENHPGLRVYLPSANAQLGYDRSLLSTKGPGTRAMLDVGSRVGYNRLFSEKE